MPERHKPMFSISFETENFGGKMIYVEILN